jgi:hypothetical protein
VMVEPRFSRELAVAFLTEAGERDPETGEKILFGPQEPRDLVTVHLRHAMSGFNCRVRLPLRKRSRRRGAGRLGRRRNRLKRRRRHGGRSPLDPQDEAGRSAEEGNRSRVRSRRRRFGGLAFRRVGGAMLLRAGQLHGAEDADRQGPTDELHRSPSAADNFCRSELEMADPLWRAGVRHLLQVIAM